MRGGKDTGLSRSLFATNLTLGALALGVQVTGAFGAVAGRGAYFHGPLLPLVPDVHFVPSHGRHG